MNRTDAIAAVESLFGDAGASVLAAARVQSWAQVFSILPEEALQVEDDGDRLAAERLLERLRDLCARGGKLREALAITRGLLRSRVSRLGEDHPASLVELGALGQLAERAGRGEEALELLQRAYDGLAAHRSMALAIVASNLGAARLRRGDLDGAAAALEMAYRVRKELAPNTLASTTMFFYFLKS